MQGFKVRSSSIFQKDIQWSEAWKKEAVTIKSRKWKRNEQVFKQKEENKEK